CYPLPASRQRPQVLPSTTLCRSRAVSQDTTFSIACEALDYECFDHQLSGEPIAGIGPWYNRWRSVTVTDEAGLQKLRDRIFADIDRKSTRLNSSHVKNSYAVFCL